MEIGTTGAVSADLSASVQEAGEWQAAESAEDGTAGES
jgi:hypothetical protein